MKSFVVDANILFSAIISCDGKTYRCVLSDEYTLYAPDYIIDELIKYQAILSKKQSKVDEIIKVLLSHIIIVPLDHFREEFVVRTPIMQNYDIKDTAYVSLAHYLRVPLRTNDKKLHQIPQIQAISSTQLFD
jgi:predicted nucleic acid-binding protein